MANLKTLMQDLKGIGAHNAAADRPRGMLGRRRGHDWNRRMKRYRLEGRLPATFEVIYGHAWVGDKTQRADGRQIIQFNIGSAVQAGAETNGLFITGTDTGVGKTLVGSGLHPALRARGCA